MLEAVKPVAPVVLVLPLIEEVDQQAHFNGRTGRHWFRLGLLFDSDEELAAVVEAFR